MIYGPPASCQPEYVAPLRPDLDVGRPSSPASWSIVLGAISTNRDDVGSEYLTSLSKDSGTTK